jgi:antitoxin FitA
MTPMGLPPGPVVGQVDIMISNGAMAQLVVRDLEEEVKRRLQKRARRHGRSMEAEVREILRSAVAGDAKAAEPLGSRLAARFSRIGLDEALPELRGQLARPAKLRR